ncbi:helix-turn-helix domain-containing protein [Thermomicrobiaceae bacterium CFH 74404]|uniref:Helix-turn-helix domain-containing protein n=1 Tax=Thermalbibacter longus TaxID=2951981 RepID=A0AA41WG95_9BACT|nr:helix-turn-helix domain-containing protein [Thermalbibacter longus]MCM8749563.1 helix-turn-helix domain-containing protein [Thermalbibacter longus]
MTAVIERQTVKERLVTVKQAADMLQLKPATIRTWIRQGKIRAVYLGSDAAGYRIPLSEIERLLRLPEPPEEEE